MNTEAIKYIGLEWIKYAVTVLVLASLAQIMYALCLSDTLGATPSFRAMYGIIFIGRLILS